MLAKYALKSNRRPLVCCLGHRLRQEHCKGGSDHHVWCEKYLQLDAGSCTPPQELPACQPLRQASCLRTSHIRYILEACSGTNLSSAIAPLLSG